MAGCSHTGYRVISRANALLLPNSCRHAAHAMLHSPFPDDKKLFGTYSPCHAVLLQFRFDGTVGFPGGFIEEGESIEYGLKRELCEELGPAAVALDITEQDLVVSHVCPDKPVCIHFYCKKVEQGLLHSIERGVHDASQYGAEVPHLASGTSCWKGHLRSNISGLGLHFSTTKIILHVQLDSYGSEHKAETLGIIRCPLYTLKDNRGGLPSFLRNNFIGNAREQLLIGLKHEGLLSDEEIKEAVTRYTILQSEVHHKH